MDDGIDPPEERIAPRLIDLHGIKVVNVQGREEHESFLKDPKKCEEHGLDIYYETMVYLQRWGGWLKDEKEGE